MLSALCARRDYQIQNRLVICFRALVLHTRGGPSGALLRPLPQDVPLLSAAPQLSIAGAAPAHRPQLACRRHLVALQEPGRSGGKREQGLTHRWPPSARRRCGPIGT